MNTQSHASAYSNDPYKTQTLRWRAADAGFARWSLAGVALNSAGELQMDIKSAHKSSDPYSAGTYNGGDYYNGGGFYVGEATSPVSAPDFLFSEAVPSWNAATPEGTWIEVQMRARVGTLWTRWFSMGVWASSSDDVARHSVSGQKAMSALVDVDTLRITKRGLPFLAAAYQLRLRLFSADGKATPTVSSAAVVVSTVSEPPTYPQPGDPALWGHVLEVPECSQMVYPEGGEVWCSPTSMAMVLDYWAKRDGSCSADVHAAVSGVYDRVYDGHGNWPFNAAYAGTQGMESYVTRFTGFAQAEKWIAAGVPLVMSVSWGKGQLDGAPISASNGHLMVLVGFDSQGNPVVNDPAALDNGSVQRTYNRAQLEKLWLHASGGTAYVVYPHGFKVPSL